MKTPPNYSADVERGTTMEDEKKDATASEEAARLYIAEVKADYALYCLMRIRKGEDTPTFRQFWDAIPSHRFVVEWNDNPSYNE